MRRGSEAGEDEVAAKHDGKHARANMWVTHQNLARQKGGKPGYQFKERTRFQAPKAAPAAASTEQAPPTDTAPATAAASPASEASE